MKKIFYGWWVVVALFVVGMLGPMARYTITAFGPYLNQEFDFDATSLGFALSLCLWVYAFASIPAGWLIDRVGGRWVIFSGGLILLLGLWGLSAIHSIWQLYLIFGVVLGIGTSITHYVATQSTARKWFTKKAGLAAGILCAAFYAGVAIFSPVLTVLSASFGWRNACLIYGLISGITIMLLALLVIRNTPESIGLHPDGQIIEVEKNEKNPENSWKFGEAIGTFTFWMVFMSYCLIGIPSQGLMGHIILWAVELGIDKATAGVFLTACTASSALAAIFGGGLADKYGKRKVLIICYTIAIILLLLFGITVKSPLALIIFTLLLGVTWGIAAGPGLWAAYLGDLFGRDSVGRLFGVLTFGYGFISGSGPFLWGKIHDYTGTYNLACIFSALCLVIVVIGIALAKPVATRYKIDR